MDREDVNKTILADSDDQTEIFWDDVIAALMHVIPLR